MFRVVAGHIRCCGFDSHSELILVFLQIFVCGLRISPCHHMVPRKARKAISTICYHRHPIAIVTHCRDINIIRQFTDVQRDGLSSQPFSYTDKEEVLPTSCQMLWSKKVKKRPAWLNKLTNASRIEKNRFLTVNQVWFYRLNLSKTFSEDVGTYSSINVFNIMRVYLMLMGLKKFLDYQNVSVSLDRTYNIFSRNLICYH